MADTKPCPRCGKNMIRVSTGVVFMTYPAQHPMKWWCGCGHEEAAETIHEKTEEEMRLSAWDRINPPCPANEPNQDVAVQDGSRRIPPATLAVIEWAKGHEEFFSRPGSLSSETQCRAMFRAFVNEWLSPPCPAHDKPAPAESG